MTTTNANIKGIGFPLLVALINSLQNVAVKFHVWTLLTVRDWAAMGGLGLVWAGWMYFMTRAYSVAQASMAAPFEYASLPINIMWGLAIWQEIPTVTTLAGAFLTLLSGLYILVREQKVQVVKTA